MDRNELAAEVGKRIRAARDGQEVSQTDLCEALGVTQTAVSYWEAGKRLPKLTDLVAVAEALHLTTSQLLPDGRPPDAVEAAVRRDLGRFKNLNMEDGVRGTLAEMALRLSRSIDAAAATAGSAAGLSALARAHQELRATLGALTEVTDAGDDPASAGYGTPVRDGSDTGAADVGASGRPDRSAAG